MKLEGQEIVTRTVQIDVCIPNVIDQLKEIYQSQQKIPRSAYINSATGNWDYWTDTGHGSGLTDVIRPATDEEKSVMEAFQLIKSSIKVPV